jgi:F-type H+-transporting ATPase subunit delta
VPAALAFRYARALAGLAAAPGVDPEAVARQLSAFETALKESAELRTALESPAVPPGRKHAVVRRLAQVLPVSDLVLRFLLVVVDHRRTALLADIREALETVMDERLGVVRADLVSARELAPERRGELVAALSSVTGKRVRPRFSVNAALIGGVVARVGSTVYDGSVRGQLRVLRSRLAAGQA